MYHFRYLIALYIHIRIITPNKPKNSLFTVSSSIFLYALRPTMPPMIPPDIITVNCNTLKWGILLQNTIYKRLNNWLNKIIKCEFGTASFVVIEKKKNRNNRLNGPPPIPRKLDSSPSKSPIIIERLLYYERQLALTSTSWRYSVFLYFPEIVLLPATPVNSVNG